MFLPLGGILFIKSGSRIIRQNIFRAQIMPLSAGCILKCFGEHGRLSLYRTLFHIERAMPALLRRKDILRLTGRDEFHIPLPGLVGTGIRQPAANQLSGRNGIGVYRQRISDTHPLGSDYRLVFFLHGGNHFGQIFFVHLLTSA